MIILLILYFIFLVAYLAFNVYALFRVWSIRTRGDGSRAAILIYMVVVGMIIFVSLIMLTGLSWPNNFKFF